MKRLIIDFDKTIVNSSYPNIKGMKRFVKKVLGILYKHHLIIINTCRAGTYEQEAKDFLEENGVKYDYFNENDKMLIDFYKTDTRKLSGDIYIDDKNMFGVTNWIMILLYVFFSDFKSYWNYWFKPMPEILSIVGESGTGKTTLAEWIEKVYKFKSLNSYTERPKRKPDEQGHTFLSSEEFDKLKVHNLLAITNFGGNRYCTLKSDLDTNTPNIYVIDEVGLKQLNRFNKVYYNNTSLRLYRNADDRLTDVGEERFNRDKGRFTMKPNEFNKIIKHDTILEMKVKFNNMMLNHISMLGNKQAERLKKVKLTWFIIGGMIGSLLIRVIINLFYNI